MCAVGAEIDDDLNVGGGIVLSSVADLQDLANEAATTDFQSIITGERSGSSPPKIAPGGLGSDTGMSALGERMRSPGDFEEQPTQVAGAGQPKRARLVDRGEIARGGMGSIRRVFDRYVMRYVAVKVLDPNFVKARADAPGRFLEEAQITGQLDHPNIVPVYDLGVDHKGSPQYFSMKLVQGRTLTQMLSEKNLIERGARDLEALLQIFVKVCDAVSFAHSRGVIHRDLKPDNVMIGTHGQVYLMDWGCALLRGGQRPAERGVRTELSIRRQAAQLPEDAPGTVVGSGSYMAPEQAWGKIVETDERSDVFSMGAMLYQILTKQPPYRAPGFMEAIQLAQKCEIKEPQAMVPGHVRVPAGLSRIAMKAMSRAPDDRYPSIEALKEAIEGFLHGGAWFAERRFQPGTVVVRQGDEGHAAYIIIAGRCEAYKDEPAGRTKLREMGPGDVFGETAIFTAQPRTASVVVIGSDDLTAIEITRDSLAEELALDSWMGAFVRALAVRFRDLDSRLSAMRGAEERARLLTWLRDWVVAVGTPDADGSALEAPWAEAAQALQAALGVAPDVALLACDRSEDLGVDQGRDVVRLTSPGALAARAARSRPRPGPK